MGCGAHARIVRLTVPADLEFLPILNTAIEEALRLTAAGEDSSNAFANAVMEAATNAAQYGPDGSEIEVEFRIRNDEMEVLVSDRGPGFDPNRISGADDSMASMTLRGRGVLIMKAAADESSFEQRPGGGTAVRLVKRFGEGE